MAKNSKIRRIDRRSVSSGSIIAGFVHGLAQIGSFGTAGPIANYPSTKADDAIRGDWNRVGGDMKRGFEKVREREKAKA
jgi:hypothetical protein